MQFIRKTIYGAVLLLSAFGFSACSDYLDKENSTELDLELVFNDKERVEGWLGYIYSGIPDPYLGYLQRTGWDILSDDITPSERYRQFSGWGVIPFILVGLPPTHSRSQHLHAACARPFRTGHHANRGGLYES